MSELTEKEKAAKWEKMQAINKKSFLKRQATIKLLLAKAAKAGITVTDAEVEAAIKKAK